MRIRHFVLPVLLARPLVACGEDDDTTATDAPNATDADAPAATEAEESMTEESMTAGTSMTTDAGATDIVDTAVGAGSFATLVAAVQAAELDDTLRGDGPFTVFAPTDDAFAALPAGTLDKLLASAARPAVAAAGCSPTSSTSADPHPHTRKVPPDELRLLAELQRQSAYPSVTLLLNTSPGSVLSTAERTRAGQLLDTAAARLRGNVDDGVAAGSSTSSACCSTSSPVSPPALRWRSACRPPAPHR